MRVNDAHVTGIFGRRRRMVVNGGYQHRLSLFTALLALLPPGLFFGIYYLMTAESSRRLVEASPSLEPLIRVQDRKEALLVLAALLFYGLGVYLVALLESHRTAGLLHRVQGQLAELGEGHFTGRLHPRRDDHFIEVADSVNRLTQSLHRRAEEDIALLDDLATALDEAVAGMGPVGGRPRDRLAELRGRIEALRTLKRGHLGEPARMPVTAEASDSPAPSEPSGRAVISG
jgi:hypothetical protein